MQSINIDNGEKEKPVYTKTYKAYIDQWANCSKCTLFQIERSLWAMCELFFWTIRSSLYTHFLSLRKSKIAHRFWAFAQFIRAMCPALGHLFVAYTDARKWLGSLKTENRNASKRLNLSFVS